ncbi:Jag N-terminal domain-containing protein [Candidatus Babeliales bacterium]|nr:Jag N-terminal domain-containing protein [Candidatus Babeliales bacterium]
MKSVIAQGTTVAKAIEEALKKADMPKEFFVKLLEDAQGGFLGFGAKKAKIALFFKPNAAPTKHDNLLDRNAYENFFNNPTIRKQIEQQLKEVGMEIQPIVPKKQSPQPAPAPKRVEQVPVVAPVKQTQGNTVRSMQQRQLPVHNKPKPQQDYDVRPQIDETGSDEGQSQYNRPRRSRYFRPRHRYNRSNNNDSNGSNGSGSAPTE